MGSSSLLIPFGSKVNVGTVFPVALSDFDNHFVSWADVGGGSPVDVWPPAFPL